MQFAVSPVNQGFVLEFLCVVWSCQCYNVFTCNFLFRQLKRMFAKVKRNLDRISRSWRKIISITL